MGCVRTRMPSGRLCRNLQESVLARTFAVVLVSVILLGFALVGDARDGEIRVLSIRRGEPPDPDDIVIEFEGESGNVYEVFFTDEVLRRFGLWGLADTVSGDAGGTTVWRDRGDSLRDAPWLVPFRFYQLYLLQDIDGDGLTDGAESLIHGTVPTEADPDGDGLNDGEEVSGGTNPYDDDGDNDGLSDGDESAAGTDPANPDTDDDGILDGWEANAGLDPTSGADATEDLDSDSFTNLQEFNRGTDPGNPDTDGDGLYDGWEVLTANLNPTSTDSDGDGQSDDVEDPDGDGLSNVHEFLGGDSDPATADDTHPHDPDTDGDGMPDGWERDHGFDPTSPSDGAEDFDSDGLTNRQEYESETAFNHPGAYADDDCDDDGIKDGSEPFWDSDIDGDGTINALDTDSDGDGLSDGDEDTDHNGQIAGDANGNRALDSGEDWTETDPANPDSDGDGLDDREELESGQDGFITNPTNRDTDGDGLWDNEKWRVVFRTNATDVDQNGVNDYLSTSNDTSWVALPTGPGLTGFGRLDGLIIYDLQMTSTGRKITSLDPSSVSQRDVRTPEGYDVYYLPERFEFTQAFIDLSADYAAVGWHPTLDYALVPCANQNGIIGRGGYVAKYAASINRLMAFINADRTGTSANFRAIAWHPSGGYCLIVGEEGTVLRVVSNVTFVLFDQNTTPSTGTSENLTDVCWASDGSFAVIVGDGGTVIKYVDDPRSFSQATGAGSSQNFLAASFRPGTHSALGIGDDTTTSGSFLASYNGDANHISDRSILLPSSRMGLLDVAWKPGGEIAAIVGKDENDNPVVLKYKPSTPYPPYAEAIYSQRIDQSIENCPQYLLPLLVTWRSDGLYALILAEDSSTGVSLALRYTDVTRESGFFTELKRDTGLARPRWLSAHWQSTPYGERALLGGMADVLFRLDASDEAAAIDTPDSTNPIYGRPPTFPQAVEACQAVLSQAPQRAFSDGKETRWDSGLSPRNPDADGDGLKDGDEVAFLGYADPDGDNLAPPLDTDSDGDGIADGDDLYAWIEGTRWVPVWHQDSDGDGLPNALDSDSDDDELDDGVEDKNKNGKFDGEPESNPLTGDQDGDGLKDGSELLLGLSISLLDEDGDGHPDGLDSDGDGLIDGLEPDWDSDTDGDGVLNALDQDSDSDGLPDGWIDGWSYEPDTGQWGKFSAEDGMKDSCECEDKDLDGIVDAGETDPRSADSDGDLLADGDECLHDTEPLNPDSDGDTLPDGEEVAGWTISVTRELTTEPTEEPTFAAEERTVHSNPTEADTDGDGLSDADEKERGSHPGEVDTDGDGLSDADEAHFGCELDPASADTDDDKLADGVELSHKAVFVYSERTGMKIEERSSNEVSSNPCKSDYDYDGLDDYAEFLLGTHPFRRDTDGDGLTDDTDPNPQGVENVPPWFEWSSWATDFKGYKATFHLEVTAYDDAGLSSIKIEGDNWTYIYSPTEKTEEYTRTVYPTSSYDLDILVTDINGNSRSGTVHVPSAFEAVDDLAFGGRLGDAWDRLTEFDWEEELRKAIKALLTELVESAIGAFSEAQSYTTALVEEALDNADDVIEEHVQVDCDDFGIRITAPDAVCDTLETISSAASGFGYELLKQAIALAAPWLDDLLSLDDIEDVVFDAVENSAPAEVSDVVAEVRQILEPYIDDIQSGDPDAIKDAMKRFLCDALRYLQNFVTANKSDADWEIAGPVQLINAPDGEDPIEYLVDLAVESMIDLINTGRLEVPCPQTLIKLNNYPQGFDEDVIASADTGITAALTVEVVAPQLEAARAGIYFLWGYLYDGGRKFQDVYVFVSWEESVFIWQPEWVLRPVDIPNVAIAMPYSDRARSELGMSIGPFYLPLDENYRYKGADVSLTHFTLNVNYSFPLLLINERKTP